MRRYISNSKGAIVHNEYSKVTQQRHFCNWAHEKIVNQNFSFDNILLRFMLRVSARIKPIVRQQFNKTFMPEK
jgi:hypothetical protein